MNFVIYIWIGRLIVQICSPCAKNRTLIEVGNTVASRIVPGKILPLPICFGWHDCIFNVGGIISREGDSLESLCIVKYSKNLLNRNLRQPLPFPSAVVVLESCHCHQTCSLAVPQCWTNTSSKSVNDYSSKSKGLLQIRPNLHKKNAIQWIGNLHQFGSESKNSLCGQFFLWSCIIILVIIW